MGGVGDVTADSPSTSMILARSSRSASAWRAIARFMVSGSWMSFSLSGVTGTPSTIRNQGNWIGRSQEEVVQAPEDLMTESRFGVVKGSGGRRCQLLSRRPWR